MDHELSQLLLYLDAPDAVAKTVALLLHAATREDEIYYAMRLRTVTQGWTPETREAYLGWFARRPVPPRVETQKIFRDVDLPYAEGADLKAYFHDFRAEFAAATGTPLNETPSDIAERASITNFNQPPAAHRKFVNHWKYADLGRKIYVAKSSHAISRGKAAFVNGQCVLCHRFNGIGGVAGPDLTAVSSRMTPGSILRAILEPSDTIPDPYKNTLLFLNSGDVVCGRIVEETEHKLVVMTDLIHQTTVEVKVADIESRRLSKVSPMPEGLLNSMTEDEIWDLMSYLESGAGTYAQSAE